MIAGNASDGSVGEALVADVLTQTPTASAEVPVADMAAAAPVAFSAERVAETPVADTNSVVSWS